MKYSKVGQGLHRTMLLYDTSGHKSHGSSLAIKLAVDLFLLQISFPFLSSSSLFLLLFLPLFLIHYPIDKSSFLFTRFATYSPAVQALAMFLIRSSSIQLRRFHGSPASS
ncbi:hypothetical protein BDV06DRAFT_71011 [Aspergillus oleicola]